MSQKLIPYVDLTGKNHSPIHIDPATGILYYNKRHNGRYIKFSLKCKADQLQRAKRISNEELTKRLGLKKKVKVTSLIKDEIPNWIESKRKDGIKDDSVKNIVNVAKVIQRFWGNRFPHEMLDPDTRTEFYNWFANEYPNHQMENIIKHTRSLSGFLCQKIVNGVPLLPIRPKFQDPNYKTVRRARKKKKENIFTAEDFQRIYQTAANSDEALLILFMYCMAARVTEAISLSFDKEIILDAETPIYRWSDGQNKADLDGYHALHPALIEPLKALKARRDLEGTKRLFPQKWNNQSPLKPQQIDWSAWRKRAGIGFEWTSHTCRHSCLSYLFNDEKNPQALICKLYRVSLQVAFETYIKPTKQGVEKMKEPFEVKL